MAFGFPARFKQSRAFQLSEDELRPVVTISLENLGWVGYEIGGAGEFRQRLHNSPMTWGEELTIKLLPGGVIEAESKCVAGGVRRMPQIFDFGANRQNIEKFFAGIEETIRKRGNPLNQTP